MQNRRQILFHFYHYIPCNKIILLFLRSQHLERIKGVEERA